MIQDSSSDSLNIDNNSSVHMKSQGSIKTFTTLPPGAVVVPINFGVKYKPAKLGLEYKLQDLPADQICIYEVTLTSYIEQGLDTTQIVDLIFELHGEFINPKIIARRQVTRLIDRLLTRVAPDLILNRSKNRDNKENSQTNNAAEATPARPGGGQSLKVDRHEDLLSKPENANDSKGRKNLALQLNQVRMQIEPTVESSQAAPEPLLEQAPESERSNAFSIPISASEGDSSARQGFNCVQNFAKSGKAA